MLFNSMCYFIMSMAYMIFFGTPKFGELCGVKFRMFSRQGESELLDFGFNTRIFHHISPIFTLHICFVLFIHWVFLDIRKDRIVI